MKKIILLCAASSLLAACGVQDTMDAVKETPGKMDTMTNKMDGVNEATRMQKVGIALQELQKPENGKTLSPVPAGLIPWAKVFAESATPSEIVEITYLWTKKVNEEVYPDLVDSVGAAQPRTGQQITDINQSKYQTIYALMSIAGQLPDSAVNAIIGTYITGNSEETRFRSTAYSVLMMRVQFLRDVFLEASLFSESIDSAGKLEKAIRYTNQMDFILAKPFAGSLKVKFTGFMPMPGQTSADPVEESMTKQGAKDLAIATWTKLRDKAVAQTRATQDDLTGNSAENDRLAKAEESRVKSALGTIEGSIKRWESKP